jgi:phenylacetate-CoA ligase
VTEAPDTFDPIEAEPWEKVLEQQLSLADKALQSLRTRSAFYSRRLDEAGLGPDFVLETWDSLEAIPTTDKNDIRRSLAAAPPLGEHLGVPPEEVVQIQATSGTTGSPSYLALTQADVGTWAELGARAFFAAGLRRNDVVLHAWSLSKGFTGGVPVVAMLQRLGATVLPVGAEAGVQRILTVAKEQRAVALCTTPNFALYLADVCAETIGIEATELAVRSLVVGGEPGGGIAPIRRRIEEGWGASCCEVLGNSDIATMVWAECPDRSGMHFVGQGLVLAEIVDPDTGKHVDMVPGATGELIYTALVREASALLRFQSGDLVEVLGTECPCGRTSPKIRCFARTDDMLLVRGVNVWPTAVQEVVAGFRPRTTGAMRILVDFEGHATNRHLKLELEQAAGLTADEAAALENDVAAAIRSRLVFQADVKVVARGVLEPPGAAKVRLVQRVPAGGAS